MSRLDLPFVRGSFPALSEPTLEGWAFMENAGGSYPCRQTIERLTGFYERTKVQPYGYYPASIQAGREMDETYDLLSGWLGVRHDEVHIGPSTSQNTYVLAKAFAHTLTTGDEIVVTNQDHEANSGAWRRLADSGATVREWPVDPDSGQLDPSDLESLLSERTRLVAFPHCSNIVGHVNPVADITKLIGSAGAISVVDGVSAAPHGLPNIDSLGADVYLFSTYKTFGPHQGVMVVRRAVGENLPNQAHWFNDLYPHKRLVPAGPDHAQVAACRGVLDYFDLLHDHHFDDNAGFPQRGRRVHDLVREHETMLLEPLLSYLRGRADMRVLGPTDPNIRVPTVSIVPPGDPAAAAATLAEHKVMAGAGDFYAVRVIEAMGQPANPGVLRLSFVHYTSPEEITQTIEALEKV